MFNLCSDRVRGPAERNHIEAERFGKFKTSTMSQQEDECQFSYRTSCRFDVVEVYQRTMKDVAEENSKK